MVTGISTLLARVSLGQAINLGFSCPGGAFGVIKLKIKPVTDYMSKANNMCLVFESKLLLLEFKLWICCFLIYDVMFFFFKAVIFSL